MKRFLTAAFIATLATAPLAAQEGQNMYKYQLGNFTIITLVNNTGQINESLIASKVDLAPYKTEGWNNNAMNYFLLDTGAQKILFDAGTPAAAGGKVIQRLAEAGLKADDIDIICITHMHGDHIGGMLDEKGQKVFPKAKVYIAREEAAYWQKAENKSGDMARAVLQAYEDTLVKFPKNTQIVEGVKSVPLFGHTPGHTGFEITSNGKKLLIWGDLLHANVQFTNPDIYLSYDIDPAAAKKIRKQTLQNAAKKGFYIAGMHLVPPAIGRVEKAQEGYKFIPGI